MMKIDSFLLLLKQYNLKNNEMSNLIKENKDELITKDLSLDELLSNLNLDNNNLNQLIAQKLLDLNLPLAKHYFSEIEEFLNSINLNEENLDLNTVIKVALLLKELDLPLRLDFFELFKESFNLDDSLADNINQLLELLTNQSENDQTTIQEIKETVQQVEKNTVTTEKIDSLLNDFREELTLTDSRKDKIVNLLNEFLINNNLIPEKEQLEQMLLIFNNFSEGSANDLLEIKPQVFNTLFALLFNLDESDQNKAPNYILPYFEEIINSNQEVLEFLSKNLSEDETKKVSEFEKAVEKIKDLIISPDNISPEAIKESINSFNTVDKESTFIKFIFNLNKNSNESLAENDKFNQATENLLNQLSANKILNYNNDLINLFLPFFIKQEAEIAEIKINKEENNSQEKDSLKFSFIFSSSKLGDLEVKVKLEENNLSTLFITEQEETDKLIKDNLDKLKENLSDKFNLQFIGSKLITPEEKENENIKLTSIDFKI